MEGRTIADTARLIREMVSEVGQRASKLVAALGPAGARLHEDLVSGLTEAIEGLAVASTDLADRSVALEESRRRYRDLFAKTPDGVLETDASGVVIEASDQAASMLGLSPAEMIGKPVTVFVSPGERSRFIRLLGKLAVSGESNRTELELHPRRGRPFLASITVAPIDAGTNRSHLLWDIRDFTDRRRLERRLAHAASHDPLTRVYNRSHFFEILEALLVRHRATDRAVAVMFIDLDRFKEVNDRFGHDVGDEMLVLVSERLVSVERRSDIVARLGGDEFVIACTDISGKTEAMALAGRVREALSLPHTVGGRTIEFGATIGVALSEPGQTAAELLQAADAAMYWGKELGRNRCEFYDEGIKERFQDRRQLREHLHEALVGGELTLVYQPLAPASGGRVCGVEALVAWDRPVRGLGPDDFIQMAERAGMVRELDGWILAQSSRAAAAWGRAGAAVDLYVNLSALQPFDAGLLRGVREAILSSGVDPRRVCLELTEGAALELVPSTVEVLEALRSDGVGLALDDFGTGYSSMSHIRELPITAIKLETSFACLVESSSRDRLIVSAITQLAGVLGITTIATGVETDGHRQAFTDLGCDLIQGPLLGPPLAAGDVALLSP